MVNRILLIPLILLSGELAAQNGTNSGLLEANLTLTPGFMIHRPVTNIYLHGYLEYFPENKISIRGDGFFHTGNQGQPSAITQNHSLLFGGVYHFCKGNLDPFFGLQQGLQFTRSNLAPSAEFRAESSPPAPVISGFTGLKYYVHPNFHLFASLRYLKALHFSPGFGMIAMDEIRISAGLSLQVDTKK